MGGDPSNRKPVGAEPRAPLREGRLPASGGMQGQVRRTAMPTRHLVVGGGMTGHAAAAAIREADRAGTVAMLAAEPERPYARPPLSKGLWLGKPEDEVFL